MRLRINRASATFIVLPVLLLLPGTSAGQQVFYRLSMPEPWTHCFEVELRITGLDRSDRAIDLLFPAWRSGRYEIMDFAGGVIRFAAGDARGTPLRWEKKEKGRWRISRGGQTEIRVAYTLYADEFRNRTRGLNAQHGFVDGSAVFMYPEGLRDRPLELRVDPYSGWRVTTALDRVEGEATVFRAPSYDRLADSPLEIGTHRELEFDILGKRHAVAIYGRYDADLDSLTSMISRIVKAHAAFWGGLPYERYLFIIHAIPGAGGGTEHANSCVIGVSPFASPRPVPRDELRSVLSHEFFHVWNVKRLRPKGMKPYDWTKENYYRELWLAEGGTSYLHGRSLARFESRPFIDVDGIGAWIDAHRARPGNRVQSLTESSFDAWVKFSRRNPQGFNYESDLYGTGALVCGLMDLEIRHRSGNRRGFDDLMRLLYKRFPESGPGYTVEDVERVASEVASSDMREFFRRFVHGAEAPDWPRFLGYAGLELLGSEGAARVWWGVAAEEDGGGRFTVRQVVRGSSADAAGLQSGDELLAIDGRRVTPSTLNDRVAAYAGGDTLRVLVAREEQIREIPVPLLRYLPPRAVVRKRAEAGDLDRAIFASWTGAPW